MTATSQARIHIPNFQMYPTYPTYPVQGNVEQKLTQFSPTCAEQKLWTNETNEIGYKSVVFRQGQCHM